MELNRGPTVPGITQRPWWQLKLFTLVLKGLFILPNSRKFLVPTSKTRNYLLCVFYRPINNEQIIHNNIIMLIIIPSVIRTLYCAIMSAILEMCLRAEQ